MIDPQDKAAWVAAGNSREQQFLNEFPKLGLDLIIHPDKGTDRYSVDLFSLAKNMAFDLKCQDTPFYSAGRYNCNPNTTVTFNHNDYIRYRGKFPEEWENRDGEPIRNNMGIIFWVHWPESERFGSCVMERHGVLIISLNKIDGLIRNRLIPCHEYQNRMGDAAPNNSKHSWLIDFSLMRQLVEIV
jgi:hypothetical protein